MSTDLQVPYRVVREHDYVTRVVVIRDGEEVVVEDPQEIRVGEHGHIRFLHRACGELVPSFIDHTSKCDKHEVAEDEAAKA